MPLKVNEIAFLRRTGCSVSVPLVLNGCLEKVIEAHVV